jgi:hypothetical protein
MELALASLGERAPGARVRGLVKPANVASRRVFESLGFDEVPGDDVITYTRLV